MSSALSRATLTAATAAAVASTSVAPGASLVRTVASSSITSASSEAPSASGPSTSPSRRLYPPYAQLSHSIPRALSPLDSRKARPALQILRALRTTLFEQTHNPTKARTGAKYLRKPLIGPKLTAYYPPQLKLSAVRSFLLDPARLGRSDAEDIEGALEAVEALRSTPEEQVRLADVARRKALGKGPPKKGEGRRAAMKTKGKK